MAKSVKIDVDAATGSLSVVEGALFLGERVPIVFTGYAPDTGNTLRLTLFAKDGITPLADNHSNANVLDLGYEKLRDAFGGKRIPVATVGQFRYEQENQWAIPFSASVIELTANGSAVGVLARGSLNVVWSPYVIDPVSGAPATLKGDKGDRGVKGDSGAAGYISRMRDANGVWHDVSLVEDAIGGLVLEVDTEESSGIGECMVDTTSAQTITGNKTFNGIFNATNLKKAPINLIGGYALKNAVSIEMLWDFINTIGVYLSGGYRFFAETVIEQNEFATGTTTSREALWKNNSGQTGIFSLKLDEIEQYAFYGASGLNNIYLPNLVTIGDFAFASCTALTDVSIPSCTSIGANAFENCTSLNDVYIEHKTREQIAAMENFPFGRAVAACRFHGSNGYVDGTGVYGRD